MGPPWQENTQLFSKLLSCATENSIVLPLFNWNHETADATLDDHCHFKGVLAGFSTNVRFCIELIKPGCLQQSPLSGLWKKSDLCIMFTLSSGYDVKYFCFPFVENEEIDFIYFLFKSNA